jgi:hypothetical protein
MFALLFQALLPAVHHPAGMAMAGLPSLDGGQHLCLAPGSLPPAPGGTDRAPVHHMPACAICQAVHAIGGFAPPAAPVIVARLSEPALPTPVEPVTPASRPQFRVQQPRGPPTLV